MSHKHAESARRSAQTNPMLQLKNICKTYKTNNLTQKALDDVSLNLRDHEFVMILGPSGSGKTTLLNIIGGLDRYDSGEMIINGVSTTKYNDRSWDTYRNHSVGFVFQSYNLIPHQTVLANVEIAMTISGVSVSERRRKAEEALAKVGLSDHIHKKPNQLSGGQMQRVAIARALVNDPEIVLADEPTGALDTETSIQVMDILSEVARERLVVMVTHNNELAEKYATRVVRIRDGKLLDDTDPFIIGEDTPAPPVKSYGRKAYMSFLTALSLSFNNLKTKLGRTILVALAGSIGIIGIAMILSMSNGANRYIQNIEETTVLQYPITINRTGISFLNIMTGGNATVEDGAETQDMAIERLATRRYAAGLTSNDLASLKAYLESDECDVYDYAHTVEYTYSLTPLVYRIDKDSMRQVHPEQCLNDLGMSFQEISAINLVSFFEMPAKDTLYKDQYAVVAGHWPENRNEAVVVLSANGGIPDTVLYALNMKPNEELDEIVHDLVTGVNVEIEGYKLQTFAYDEFLGRAFKVVNRHLFFEYDKDAGIWVDKNMNEDYKEDLVKNSEDLVVVGVVKPKDADAQTTLSSGINYTHDLVVYLAEEAAGSEIVKQQLADPETNVFTGKPFGEDRGVDELEFKSIFEVDEDAFADLFTIDESAAEFPAINFGGIDLSQFAGMLDLSGLDASVAPEDILNIIRSISPEIALNSTGELVNSLSSDFGKYLGEDVLTSPEQISSLLNEYLAGDEARELFRQTAAAVIARAVDEEGVYDPEKLNFTEEDLASLSASLSAGFANYISPQTVLTPEELAEKFRAFMNTDAADADLQQFIRAFTESPALKTAFANLLNNTMSKISSQMQSKLSGTFASIMSAVGTQIGNTITDAMKEYMENLTEAFTFNQDALAEAFRFNLSEDEIKEMIASFISGSADAYTSNLSAMGYADMDNPSSISIYPKDFESKAWVTGMLSDYNTRMKDEGKDAQVISYTDFAGTMMSSVSEIVGAVSTVLIGLVAISLVVSSIMISVITHISVLERQKEIGILRAIGASKKNISDVFNAETFIIGLFAGLLGIAITSLLIIAANYVIHNIINQPGITAFIKPWHAIVLIALSVGLNVFSGLIPAYKASKSDPVIALRGE